MHMCAAAFTSAIFHFRRVCRSTGHYNWTWVCIWKFSSGIIIKLNCQPKVLSLILAWKNKTHIDILTLSPMCEIFVIRTFWFSMLCVDSCQGETGIQQNLKEYKMHINMAKGHTHTHTHWQLWWIIGLSCPWKSQHLLINWAPRRDEHTRDCNFKQLLFA